MTTRRRFIQTLAALPPAFAFRHARAAADPSRLALIIGNSSYRDAPLVNPANDAKAVSGLFTQAGFTVDSRLNATRADMMAAIERFGAAVKRPDTKLVVFYYAGHGAQLDWRNYLLPVDAVVEKQEHMKQRCVDLGLLLGQFSAAKDKTFVVILDACRNNPFGTSYRPEQKGLSQFDAPVGSLLAYATSPGNVASDGDGQNGLYTENLVRELGKRNTRIEDALKRVRLNVRLASHGAQIPWETTSLEGDVFIFNEGQKKLTEAEMDQAVEADITEWTRIKSSKITDDWVGYLRSFPNGRFAEIAQMRLTRLLAEDEKRAAEKRQREEQLRLEQERVERERTRAAEEQRLAVERERIRLAEVQRLAAERKLLEEQQLQEQRRRQEEQQRLEAKNRMEQERLERERQRIAEAERLAEQRRQEEEQRRLAEQKRLALEAEKQQKEELRNQEEQKRLGEQKRLDAERAERERIRLQEAQRLAAERKQLEAQQLQETRRREEEQKRVELGRRQEQERLDRERQRIAEAERLADERKQQEQRQLVEQKRIEQQKMAQAATAKPAPVQPASTVPASSAPAPDPARTPDPKPAATAAAATPGQVPMIDIGEGAAAVPKLIAQSANPFSAGRYPLNRIFTVGDAATIRKSDILTGVEEQIQKMRVTKIDHDADRVEFNQGAIITDLMGNFIKQGPNEFDSPVQFTPAEFQVGKKWTAAFHRISDGRDSNVSLDLHIVKRETITVPAGTFDTFRIEGEGWNVTRGNRREVKFWLVPNLNFAVRTESVTRNKRGQLVVTERRELVALRQHTIAL